MTMSEQSDPLKIVLASWAPFIGGAEVAVERLAIGLRDAGHDVRLIVGTRGEALDRFTAAGLRCEFIEQRFTDKLGWLKYRRARKQVLRNLSADRPDLVHSNDLPTHQLISDAAGRLGLPRVCHHRWVFERGAIDWLNKFGAERHLFISKAFMKQMLDASEKLRRSASALVYDGLPLPSLTSKHDQIQLRQMLGMSTEKMVIAFTGQIIERKGVADLLRGWSELAPRWSERAELCLVGDDLAGEGAYRREMEALATSLGVPARFVGFQKNVDDWLAAADIAVVPSHIEPLGLAAMEAMSHARPVIGGDAGGIPEMIVHEETGLLVPPKTPSALAAALERLLSDASLRERMGRAARRRCEEQFSLDAHVCAVVAEYRTVLAHATAGVR